MATFKQIKEKMEQKFKRGNLVKVLSGHVVWDNKTGHHDIKPEEVGKTAIVEYSYNDRYGGGNTKDYSIIFTDTGHSVAWKSENELEFLEEGGEHLFEEARIKHDSIIKSDTDLKNIISTWDEKKGRVSSATILFLFDKIGFKSHFINNGEFYSLSHDWSQIYPLFNLLMTAKTELEVMESLSEKANASTKGVIVSFFNEIKSIKSENL